MATTYSEKYAVHPSDYVGYNSKRLRDNFLVSELFVPDSVQLTYTHYDRFIVGGACPVTGAVSLDPIDALKAAYFLERRELGVINVGGNGAVLVDGERYSLGYKEALYVGQGAKQVVFYSDDTSRPAKFYLNSAPADKSCPIQRVGLGEVDAIQLGTPETANERILNKLMVNGVVETCQLQMGMTEIKSGSVWNTMPAHTHSRRMETYFYFELPEDQAVCHFMGPKEETRHLWLANEQAVISPPWSIHSGAGTSSYTFIWGMAGENLDYDDMDKIMPADFTARGEG